MTIEVELSQLFTDDYARLQALTREITRQLKNEILVTPRVKLVPKRLFTPSRKARLSG